MVQLNRGMILGISMAGVGYGAAVDGGKQDLHKYQPIPPRG
jgi:hypothetical protein